MDDGRICSLDSGQHSELKSSAYVGLHYMREFKDFSENWKRY